MDIIHLKKISLWTVDVIFRDESLFFLQEKTQKSHFLGIMVFRWF